MTSTETSPTYNGSTGSSARFVPTCVVAKTIGWDSGPKEVAPITRITKSSQQSGKVLNSDTSYENTAANGESTTTINLNKGELGNNFDIFYFFHNDPTHYSIDDSRPYYTGAAQYVISDVKPQ